MILEHQNIELLGKGVFERIKFKPPLNGAEIMQDEACLVYAANGNSKMFGGYQTDTLTTGDSVLMKCGNFVNQWQKIDEDSTYEAVAIHLYPDVIEYAFDNNVPNYLKEEITVTSELVYEKISQNVVLQSYISGLMIYLDNPSLFNAETIKLKLRELISLLYALDSHGIRELLSSMFQETHLDFKKLINAHVLSDLKLEDYALMLGMSLSTFKRKFKEVYASSPKQYFINAKLDAAAERLILTDLRINEICYDCGFGDTSNFTKAFSKKFGISPTDYRLKNKK